MTKKHFRALADAMLRTRPIGSEARNLQWLEDIRSLSRACAEINPRFDMVRFIAWAEGLPDSKDSRYPQ